MPGILILSKAIKKWTLQAGLRVENRIATRQPGINDTTHLKEIFTDLFPECIYNLYDQQEKLH